jgi:hypothetical protein
VQSVERDGGCEHHSKGTEKTSRTHRFTPVAGRPIS